MQSGRESQAGDPLASTTFAVAAGLFDLTHPHINARAAWGRRKK